MECDLFEGFLGISRHYLSYHSLQINNNTVILKLALNELLHSRKSLNSSITIMKTWQALKWDHLGIQAFI
jgi:hypothetical protein